jgi:pimeloyl-ACP methyl ester carboxylesterase
LVLDSAAGPMRGFLTDLDDELATRVRQLYTPDQVKRLGSLSKEDAWRKASDPVALCREFYTKILTAYTYGRRLDNIGFKGDVCSGPEDAIRVQRWVTLRIWESLGDFNLMPKLVVLKAPVLVIHGVADVIPLRSSEFWASGYPNARLLVFERSGHMSHVEEASLFFPAVEKFLKGEFPANAKKVQSPVGR